MMTLRTGTLCVAPRLAHRPLTATRPFDEVIGANENADLVGLDAIIQPIGEDGVHGRLLILDGRQEAHVWLRTFEY